MDTASNRESSIRKHMRLLFLLVLLGPAVSSCGAKNSADSVDQAEFASEDEMRTAVWINCKVVWFTRDAAGNDVDSIKRACLKETILGDIDEGLVGADDNLRKRWILAAAVENDTGALVSYTLRAEISIQCANAIHTEDVTLAEVYGSPLTREAFALLYEFPCTLADGHHGVRFVVEAADSDPLFDDAEFAIELTSGTNNGPFKKTLQ